MLSWRRRSLHLVLTALLVGAAADLGTADVLLTPDAIANILRDIPPNESMRITLDTKEVLWGTFAGQQGGDLLLDHPVLGRVRVPLEHVTEAVSASMLATSVATSDKETAAALSAKEESKVGKAKRRMGWSGGIDFGLDGSQGNSEYLALRFYGYVDRRTTEQETHLDLYYGRSTSFGETGEDNIYANAKQDWLIPDRPYFAFLLGTLRYDVFRNFDVRLNAAAGPGYRLLATDRTVLNSRVGLGGLRDFGGSNPRSEMEALVGLDIWQQVTNLQGLYAESIVYPTLTDLGEFRLVNRLNYQIIIAPLNHLSLNFGIEDWYDSTPSGGKKNDFNYYTAIGWYY